MQASSQSSQKPQGKSVYQFVLKFPTQYPPYHRINPYTLLAELNKVVKQKYDMEFVHIKYMLSRNKEQKNLNEKYFVNDTNFNIDRETNNIFTCKQGDFLKNYIFDQAEKLQPPNDYSPEDLEKAWENQLKSEQMERLQSLKKKIETIMGFYNDVERYKEVSEIRSIESFKVCHKSQYFRQNQFEIYAKAYMNTPVYEKIKQDHATKDKKTQLQFKYKESSIKVFVNPRRDMNSYETVSNEYRINNWSLSTIHNDMFVNYFGTDDLQAKMSNINGSISFVSSISFNQFQSRVASFAIMAFLWNQTVIKIVVKMAQIKKIEKASQNGDHEYYFHLTYPPMFYINQLKEDEANTENFIKFPERVTNFVFLQNERIRKNQFLRYFLFNNTVLRVSLKLDNDLKRGHYLPVSQTYQKLQKLCQLFTGTVEIEKRKSLYKPKYNLRFLDQKMEYVTFDRISMPQLTEEDQDKLWMIKYLILVMVRYNYIVPTENEVGQMIKYIENAKKSQNLDCYLYVLWKTATNMWGYQDKKLKFHQYFIKQSEEVKKMNVKNIMKKILYASDSIVYIFRVSLTPSGILHNPPTPQMKGRLLKEFNRYSEFFLRLSISQESEVELKNQKYITRMYFRDRMKQIIIFNRGYDPLGWSPSQLRSFSLWYFHRIHGRDYGQQQLPRLERRLILEFLGDFSEIENPAKKAARIGQSFSSSWTYIVNNIKYSLIDDIYSSQKINFTDGIGKISRDLLQKISLRLNIRDLTVIQVRYLGAKGILVLDPELGKNEIHLRKSMTKYPCEDKEAQKYLDILDWNKYKPGYLNRQIIILLRTLGIQNVVFMQVQDEHIRNIEGMTFKDCSIFKHLGDDLNTQINNLEPANKTILSLLNAGFVLEKEPFFRGVLETLKKNGYQQLQAKSSIQIPKSARIIGIIDEDGILEEDQVYCSIYNHFIVPSIREVIDGKAIITRNPCLHPADIRIVTCVGRKQIAQRYAKAGKKNKFELLWNVVIMPLKGKYPLTSQISGSDLDGDNFFICWDDRLIPDKAHPPVLIDQPSSSAKKEKKPVKILGEAETYEKMLDFFIDYTNYEKLGQIDNSHLVHADRDQVNYANNKICLKLAEVHGKAVDFPKTGYCPPVPSELFCSEYPDFMEKENTKTYQSDSILGKLYRDIKSKIQHLLENEVEINVTEIDQSLIFDYPFDETQKQVDQIISILKQYEREMTNLINLLGVDLQYEIYTGNFSGVKDKLKIFGKNRLISSVISLRERFFDRFFNGIPEEQARKYKQTGLQEKHMKFGKYFSELTRRQAQLYYLVNYSLKFPKISDQHKGYIGLRDKIDEALSSQKFGNNEFKYCGFVWFVIPKVILNLKVTWRESQNPNENEVEDHDSELDDQYI